MSRLFAILLGLLTVSGLVACNKHGRKLTFKKGEVFYKSPATKAEATELGDFLVKMKYFDDTTRKSVQLLKVGDRYQVRFVVKESVVEKPSVVLGFQSIGNLVSGEVFAGASVEVHLCDKKLETIKTLGPFVGLGHKVELDKGEVYYRSPVKKPEAEKLAKLLKKLGYFNGIPKTVQLLRKGALTQLRFVVNTSKAKEPQIVAAFRDIGAQVKRTLLSEGKIEVHLCDIALNTVNTIR